MALISLRGVVAAHGGPPLLDGVGLQVESGDRLCLLGRNGSGKTTLLRILDGALLPDEGEIFRRQGLRASLVPQELPHGLAGTALEVAGGGPRPAGRQGVDRALSRLGLDPGAAFASLSGGTKRRVMLARALAAEPELLLLDEPTNHLDIDGIAWLEGFLLRQVRTLVFVTHDRAFARRVSNRVAELDRGRLYAFDCGYDAFVERREELLAAESAREALFDRTLAREEQWVRQGVKARRTRNEGRVRALRAMREERGARRERVRTARIRIQDAERSGRIVAEVAGASAGFAGRAVIRGLTTTILAGDRVGIIGPNGSGKTTLLRLLLGDLPPQEGTVRLGSRLEVVYFDQLRAALDPDRTVQENVAGGNETVTVNGRPRHVLGYLRDFLFTPERARTPAGVLSGGERNRLLLAKLFTRPSNVLVMDEPTNDLDVETLDLLEGLLQEYAGTILLVSHDREFLDNVVTSTLVLAGDGTVGEYVGGYEDWVRQAAAAERERAAAGPAPAKRAAGPPSPDTPAARASRPRRLSYKETRELEALPDRIAALEAEQESLQRTLADPDFYRTAGAAVAGPTARLARLEEEIAEAYRRWEELETVRPQ